MSITTLAIAHVNLNCRDLERSRAFFEALGMRAAIRTDPAAQDCRAFGFPGDARWDAWMLQDGRGLGSAAVDLLEWKEPLPIGAPPVPGTRPGLERLGFTARDLEAARKAVLAHGGRASEIHELALAPGATRTGFGAASPEGQPLLVLAADGDRLAHVGIGCTDLARSEDFYARVLGMNAVASASPGPLPADVFQPGQAGNETSISSVCWDARILYPAAPQPELGLPHPFHVVLTQWRDPSPTGRGLDAPNHLGLFRMAFLVADLDASAQELADLRVPDLSPIVTLDLGPSCPAPACRALFFRDPDGACMELIEAPRPPTS